MATVSDFVDPIFRSRGIKDPVILEGCFHTFGKEGILGSVRSELEKRIGSWDFRVPQEFDCAICRKYYHVEQVACNDTWEKLDQLLERFIQAERNEEPAESFEANIEKMPLSDLYGWRLEQAINQIKQEWQFQHCGSDIEDVKVVDFLKWKEVPLVKKLLEEWKEKYPSRNFEMLYLTDLFGERVESCRERDIDVFNDLRPAHLLGCDTYDQEKIRNAPSRQPAFPVEDWSYFESLHFIASSIYHFAVALFCEVGLYLLYFWECGFLTTKQYTDLRANYVVNRIVPLYLKYMGLPPEKPKSN